MTNAVRARSRFAGIPKWQGHRGALVTALGSRIGSLPPQLGYYRDPLWAAYLLLQQRLPDLESKGLVRLDSMIVDVSKVFEAYVRRAIYDRAKKRGWVVVDGNLKPASFFVDAGEYSVHPDIVILDHGRPVAVLDAKYKPRPKDPDRYELLSFMDAMKVSAGGFVCPVSGSERSRYLGRTAGGKAMSVLRLDLAKENPIEEADRLFKDVERVVAQSHDFA